MQKHLDNESLDGPEEYQFNIGDLADWISFCQFGFLLVKGDIYRTRLYYRIQP